MRLCVQGCAEVMRAAMRGASSAKAKQARVAAAQSSSKRAWRAVRQKEARMRDVSFLPSSEAARSARRAFEELR